MTYPIHDPSCLSLQSGTDQRGFDYGPGDIPCTCDGVKCSNCDDKAEFGDEETACGRDHCATHFAHCRACQSALADEWEDER